MNFEHQSAVGNVGKSCVIRVEGKCMGCRTVTKQITIACLTEIQMLLEKLDIGFFSNYEAIEIWDLGIDPSKRKISISVSLEFSAISPIKSFQADLGSPGFRWKKLETEMARFQNFSNTENDIFYR